MATIVDQINDCLGYRCFHLRCYDVAEKNGEITFNLGNDNETFSVDAEATDVDAVVDDLLTQAGFTCLNFASCSGWNCDRRIPRNICKNCL